MQRVRDKNEEIKCSAEGHISHVFADRMSSRPLGGAGKVQTKCRGCGYMRKMEGIC